MSARAAHPYTTKLLPDLMFPHNYIGKPLSGPIHSPSSSFRNGVVAPLIECSDPSPSVTSPDSEPPATTTVDPQDQFQAANNAYLAASRGAGQAVKDCEVTCSKKDLEHGRVRQLCQR